MRAVIGEVIGKARVSRNLKWPRALSFRRRHKTDEATADEASDRAAAPTAYRTLSAKLAPSLTATGGILALAGGLGNWVRATTVSSEGLPPEEVAAVMGYSDPIGGLVAAVGALAAIASLLWFASRVLFKLAPVLASLTLVGIIAWHLPAIDEQATAMAASARAQANLDFVAYHSGFGWGAWCLLIATVALTLGALAGILRELDLRKGNLQ